MQIYKCKYCYIANSVFADLAVESSMIAALKKKNSMGGTILR